MTMTAAEPTMRLRSLAPSVAAQRHGETALPLRRVHGSDRLKIAMLVPLSGPASLWGPSCRTSALLAMHEVNTRGGILGRKLELVFADSGSQSGTIAEDTAELIALTQAQALIGMHSSALRGALVRALCGRIPYVYTPVYEGGERSPGVFLAGETPARQLRPAIRWMAAHRDARRWYLIGKDYVWPRVTHRVVRRYIAAAGGKVVGVSYVSSGCTDHAAYLEHIRRCRPDAVLVLIAGADGVSFNRAFADHGMSAQILRLSASGEENTLLGIGAGRTENFYFSTGYLAGLETPENLDFLARYHATFGSAAPMPNAIGESCYEGVRLYAELVGRAGSLEIAALTRVSEGLSYTGARGRVTMRARHLCSSIYLAQAEGLRFDVRAHFPA